jgi:hypothetical protein
MQDHYVARVSYPVVDDELRVQWARRAARHRRLGDARGHPTNTNARTIMIAEKVRR